MKETKVGNEAELVWPEADIATEKPRDADQSTSSSTSSSPSDEENDLLWPTELINHHPRPKKRHAWPVGFAVFSFVIAALIAIAVGPTQLFLIFLTENYFWVTETYYPTAMKISLIISGGLAILNLATMFLAWRSRIKNARLAASLSGGSMIIIALLWFAAFVIPLQPNQLAVLMLLVILAFWIAALLINKQVDSNAKLTTPLRIILSLIIALSVSEVSLSSVFLISQKDYYMAAQAELLALEQAQADAQTPEVPRPLSNMVFVLCRGNYDVVFLSQSAEANTDTGLFQCQESRDVYSVLDRNDHDPGSVAGAATYLGTTHDALIEQFFPEAHYLYRNLENAELPVELVLLLTASSEEELVESQVEQLSQYLAARGNSDLTVNIFYTDNLDEVITTKDFILIAAVGTLSLTDRLPHGNLYRSFLDGAIGNYVFTSDTQLIPLAELGADPLLYPAQTRDAIKSRRHITLKFNSAESLSLDELKQKLYGGFVDPN